MFVGREQELNRLNKLYDPDKSEFAVLLCLIWKTTFWHIKHLFTEGERHS